MASAAARLVAVKVNGPPGREVVIFCTATCGMAAFAVLVKVQLILALVRIFAAGIVSTVPAKVPKVVAGLPEAAALLSEQLADVIVKFAATVSVTVTAAPVVVTRMGDAVVG